MHPELEQTKWFYDIYKGEVLSYPHVIFKPKVLDVSLKYLSIEERYYLYLLMGDMDNNKFIMFYLAGVISTLIFIRFLIL